MQPTFLVHLDLSEDEYWKLNELMEYLDSTTGDIIRRGIELQYEMIADAKKNHAVRHTAGESLI